MLEWIMVICPSRHMRVLHRGLTRHWPVPREAFSHGSRWDSLPDHWEWKGRLDSTRRRVGLRLIFLRLA